MPRMLGLTVGWKSRRITNGKLPDTARWFTMYRPKTSKGRVKDNENWKREEKDHDHRLEARRG
jgi:hypothetical protein